ncbi:MAG: FtsX-like permease family protein, partial [Oscillospiraceae bacterium]|nr:FtsX-like permease family protein [Oscillospiraceae bacterium]
LDAFYRRRELAILQSLGETGGRLTLQFSIETLILLVVSWIAAIPAAFYAVRAAIPGMLTQTAASENPFASLGGNIQMVSLDALTIQTHLRYSGGDLAFFGLFTLLTVAFCALAVWICTKRFHVRTLLNN